MVGTRDLGRNSYIIVIGAVAFAGIAFYALYRAKTKIRRNCIIRLDLEKSLRRSQAQAELSGVTSEGQTVDDVAQGVINQSSVSYFIYASYFSC